MKKITLILVTLLIIFLIGCTKSSVNNRPFIMGNQAVLNEIDNILMQMDNKI